MPAAGTARCRPGSRVSSEGARARTSLLRPFHQFVAQLAVRQSVRIATRPHDHIRRHTGAREARQHLQSERLTQAALHTITFHDGVLVSRYDHTHAWMRKRGSGVEDVQMGRPAPLPPSQNITDLCAACDPPLTRQPSSLCVRPRRRRHGCSALLLPADGDSQALAAVPPATVQNLAAGLRRHTRTKAMLVLPLAIVRAIRRHSHETTPTCEIPVSKDLKYKPAPPPRSTGRRRFRRDGFPPRRRRPTYTSSSRVRGPRLIRASIE